jgi:3-oxoadipate enol-lactonase
MRRSLLLLIPLAVATLRPAASEHADADGSALAYEYGVVEGTSEIPADTGRTASGLYWTAEGQGPAVVLIHAFSLDRRMWNGVVAELSRDHRILRFDARGHGESPDPTGSYSSYLDVLEVMDAAGVDRAWLVGLSSGSQAAADVALAASDRVSGLVLASPGLSGYAPVGSFEWFQPVGEALQQGGPDAAAEAWLATPIMDPGADPVVRGAVAGMVRENASLWALAANPDQPLVPGAFARMGEVTAPTLVLTGERDLVDTRRVAALLGYCLPDGQVEVLAGRGHLLALEDQVWFAGRVSDFIAEGSGAGRTPGETPAGCRGGEDLWGPGSFAPFAGFVGGAWEMRGSVQTLEWAVGRKGVLARQFQPSGEALGEVSQLFWTWDSESGTFEGRGVAVGMGIDRFSLATRFDGDVMVNDLTAQGPQAPGGVMREEWRPEGPDRYHWVLLGPGGEPTMEGRWIRSWTTRAR